ncbi:hypothetical protein AXG93_2528s2310 [Marchantia polymorpha subsp. ruderalis]|uniref:Uncharacterized protein n=1 Tax=Marchantia polymorpha subsp. ruderalis TaxID=1480154 RepID=A0A176WRE2_MARPO|nr:hypothetical protein AXG93_2528s2310 [Marchantia polymorpha subsp. ruderalis]
MLPCDGDSCGSKGAPSPRAHTRTSKTQDATALHQQAAAAERADRRRAEVQDTWRPRRAQVVVVAPVGGPRSFPVTLPLGGRGPWTTCSTVDDGRTRQQAAAAAAAVVVEGPPGHMAPKRLPEREYGRRKPLPAPSVREAARLPCGRSRSIRRTPSRQHPFRGGQFCPSGRRVFCRRIFTSVTYERGSPSAKAAKGARGGRRSYRAENGAGEGEAEACEEGASRFRETGEPGGEIERH